MIPQAKKCRMRRKHLTKFDAFLTNCRLRITQILKKGTDPHLRMQGSREETWNKTKTESERNFVAS
ncbi:hypothetical protein KFK09_016676 [Dendrobium nobile]|uniref:Uncharacterized protein n=1 Tax=Dendrobium nobile TaxID=94219 RepID=A0A8T3B057_DENNO|nr:hypothetical protein KFK09_016676 [Dendrobium nobile]